MGLWEAIVLLVYCSKRSVRDAVKRLRRLFSKNTGVCELARGGIGTDACPVPEG